MTSAELIALIAAGGQAITSIIALVDKARTTLSSDDAAAVGQALAELQAQNDAAFARLDAELAAAAGGAPAG
jgi:hypothetical protein